MTKPRPTVRTWARLAATVIASAALVVPMAGTATAHDTRDHPNRYPDRIALPDGFQPEGITIGPGPVAYLGSRVDGDIYAADLRTGRGRVISQGPGVGSPSVGLKSDQRGLLYVSGGTTGSGRVVDVRSGRIVADYAFTTGASFVNDVVLAAGRAWFTDSRQASIYVVPQARKGRPAPADAVRTITLRGEWVQDTTPGVNNANGLVVSPDGRSLLVVQSNTGFLFRVDPRTGYATRVDLGTTRDTTGAVGPRLLTNGDGLLVKGRTLYAVQNRLNLVSVYSLNRSGTTGTFRKTLTSKDFDVPSTVAAYRKSLYLPNARFTTPATPTTPYWVTKIRSW